MDMIFDIISIIAAIGALFISVITMYLHYIRSPNIKLFFNEKADISFYKAVDSISRASPA